MIQTMELMQSNIRKANQWNPYEFWFGDMVENPFQMIMDLSGKIGDGGLRSVLGSY